MADDKHVVGLTEGEMGDGPRDVTIELPRQVRHGALEAGPQAHALGSAELPGPAELQRIRRGFLDRANEFDKSLMMMTDSVQKMKTEGARGLAYDYATRLQFMICATPAHDLTDALAVVECAAAFFEGVSDGENSAFEKDRNQAIENAFTVIIEALVQAGADASALGTSDWFPGFKEREHRLLATVAGLTPVEREGLNQ